MEIRYRIPNKPKKMEKWSEINRSASVKTNTKCYTSLINELKVTTINCTNTG